MKKMNIYRFLKQHEMILASLSLWVFLCLISSCNENYPLYDQPDDYVYFASEDGGFKVYSFVFEGSSVTRDTIWFTVKLAGNIADHDRTFRIKQKEPDPKEANDDQGSVPEVSPEDKDIDAVSGVHYLSFDNPDYQKFLVIPANAREARFPVIIMRDPSLKTVKGVNLTITLTAGGDLLPGYINFRNSSLRISDRLVRPTQWGFLMRYVMGKYGPVKHQFMIDHTHLHWDDEFISHNYFNNYIKADQQYLFALKFSLVKALKEENTRRQAAGEKPLMEADGTEVQFGS